MRVIAVMVSCLPMSFRVRVYRALAQTLSAKEDEHYDRAQECAALRKWCSDEAIRLSSNAAAHLRAAKENANE